MTNFDEDAECTYWITLILSLIVLIIAICVKIYF